MTMRRRFLTADISIVGENEALIRMTTDALARDGDILVPGGCVLDNYRQNPIQLWQHDPSEPIGTNSDIVVRPDCIEARTTFAPAGVSPVADKVRGLVKSGIIRSVSVGFEPLDAEPIDPAKPLRGLRITKWELLECSFVSIPADPGAVVTARAVADTELEEATAPAPVPVADGPEDIKTEIVGEKLPQAGDGLGTVDDIDPEERAYGRGAATPRLNRGRILGKGSTKSLETASDHLASVADHLSQADGAHDKVTAARQSAADAHAALVASHGKLGDAIAAAKDNPDDAQTHIARALKHHWAMTRNMDAVSDGHNTIGTQAAAVHEQILAAESRCSSAVRCVRSVLSGPEKDGDGVPSGDQAGEPNDENRADRDFRRRQAEALALAAR
jgi:HK97 family phage prohead protease